MKKQQYSRREMLRLVKEINNDMQSICEDNEIQRAEMEEYFDEKIKEV